MYNKKLKKKNSKIKSFHGNKMLKKGTHCVCSLIHYVFKMGKNYYPQEFLEKCKYIVTKIR